MATDLRTELSKNLSERVEYTASLVNGFQESLSEISKKNKQLAQEMRETLDNSQKNIALSDAERIKNYDLTINAIQASIKEIRKGVNISMKGTSKMIADFSTDRSLAATEWSKMKEEIRQIQQNVVAPKRNKENGIIKQVQKVVPNVVVDTNAASIQENIVTPKPSEANEKTLVTDQSDAKKVEPAVKKAEKTMAPLSLEDKILIYLKTNSQGVKVSDMEEPLKETRMRLGFVAKKLLQLGQIRKIDNRYYPKK
jgi:hypothetical protein